MFKKEGLNMYITPFWIGFALGVIVTLIGLGILIYVSTKNKNMGGK